MWWWASKHQYMLLSLSSLLFKGSNELQLMEYDFKWKREETWATIVFEEQVVG